MPAADLFLAHAGPDTSAAEQLFDLLAPDIRVWLDARSLLPGDEWPVEIPRAQRAAMATVILVSRNADHAFYLRDEIHTAVALHRTFPGQHRVVAVFLDGRPSDPMQVPYGLRGLHTLDAVAAGGLAGIARDLRALVATLRTRDLGAPSPPLPPPVTPPPAPRPGPAPPTSAVLFERLCRLTLGGQIDAVILHAGLPRQDIAPPLATINQRALDIALIVDEGGAAMAARVAAAIAKVAPWLAESEVAAAPPAPPAPQPTPAPARLAVLLVFANPRGTSPLQLAAEERALRQAIQLASHRDRIEIEALPAATIDDLRRALIAEPRTIVHFSGHGESDGLRFEDENGDAFVPDPKALASILQRRGVETVVLNACYSLSIVAETPMGTKYTVAMQGPVGDAGAIEFSRGFYDVIGAGRGVPEAFEEGLDCAAVKRLPVNARLIKTCAS
jgi:hypothetical protein